jgi:hypothetical protein
MTARSVRVAGLSALVSIWTACGGSPTGTPSQSQACNPSTTITLSVNAGTTVDCTNGSAVTVAGNGAQYLVVPEFATGDVAYSFQPYALGVVGGGSSLIAARVRSAGPSILSANRLHNQRQIWFDLKMLAQAKKFASSGLHASSFGKGGAPPIHALTGTCGASRSFYVISNDDGTTYTSVTATLQYIGSNVCVYIDNNAPSPGFTMAQLTAFGQYADSFLYPLDVNTYGAPTDIDDNGHVIMLLTPVVNALTTTAECNSEGFIAGFFDSIDLDDPGVPPSNGGEIFYQIVPDPNGQYSCAHTVADVVSITPGTFLHELQHMINNGHHVVINHGQPEEGWLDEGESIVATELAARYYQAKYPSPSGRTNPSQLFPDSAEPFISEQLVDSYNYLTDPDTASLTLHTDADCCLAWRAGDWLLLRYVGDQFDSTVYMRLENGTVTGTANLAAATGLSFQQLFGNFGITLYADSLPGQARDAVPSQYRYAPPHNLRQYYQALYNAADGQYGVTSPFPIALQESSGGVSGEMVPGTVEFYQLTTPANASTVTFHFAPPSGGAFSSSLHAQVNLFRLQ